MKRNSYIKSTIAIATTAIILSACSTSSTSSATTSSMKQPDTISVNGKAQNPEGIEYDKSDNTFLLSSLNAMPILKVNSDGSAKPFTSGEKFPLSTAGLQIDYKRDRLLVAGFNGTELMDGKTETKGTAYLRVYNLKTGLIEQDINLSHLVPKANAYFANDIAVDDNGNAYISDWYAGVIYKVDLAGDATLFWTNTTGIASGPNGLDFHKDGYLLVSILTVNKKGLYANYGLVKIPLNDSTLATVVDTSNTQYAGFDGMVIKPNGNIVGITNNQRTPGGNRLLELSSSDNFKTAKVINSKEITASTTVALTPNGKNFVINQDFTNNVKKSWRIEKVEF